MSDCGLQDRIVIGNHDLECSGGVLQARYRDSATNRFDGVHMYGASGQKAYTASVINVLNAVQLVHRQPPKYHDELDHQNCPQARYQAKMRHRQLAPQTKPDQVQTYTGYAIPTYNRFSKLADFFPGN